MARETAVKLSLTFRQDDYVKLMAPNGDYRYGYIEKSRSGGQLLLVNLDNEGASKIAFDSLADALTGKPLMHWENHLSETEKKLIPLLASEMSTQDIAIQLLIAPVTARSHIRTLRIKLGLEDRTQLIAYTQGLQFLQKENHA